MRYDNSTLLYKCKNEHEDTPTPAASVDELSLSPIVHKSSVDNLWYSRFLLNGEVAVYTEMVLKNRLFFSKKRQLILTNRPRFIYLDLETLTQKGEIEWSSKLWIEVTSNNTFVIHTVCFVIFSI